MPASPRRTATRLRPARTSVSRPSIASHSARRPKRLIRVLYASEAPPPAILLTRGTPRSAPWGNTAVEARSSHRAQKAGTAPPKPQAMEVMMSSALESATEIRPFHFDVDQEELDDLRRRIAATRWPEKEPVEN